MSPQIISRLFASPSDNSMESLIHDTVTDNKHHVDVIPGTGQETVCIDMSLATTDYLQGYPVELDMKHAINLNLHKYTQGITKMVRKTSKVSSLHQNKDKRSYKHTCMT
jgi:hypothetical protein